MSASPPATTFPREYLLRVYTAAIDNGHILLAPITEADAASFKASFYRLRRRSDSSNKTFITPEHHLVTVGQWREENGGTLPIYFSTTEGELPTISVASGPIPAEDMAQLDRWQQPTADDTDSDFDVDAFVGKLIDRAHDRD